MNLVSNLVIHDPKEKKVKYGKVLIREEIFPRSVVNYKIIVKDFDVGMELECRTE